MLNSKPKNNKRKVDLSSRSGRKFVYHSQIKSHENRAGERLVSVPDKRKTSGKSSIFRQLPTIISFIVIIGTLFYISTLNSNPEIIIDNGSNTVNFLHTTAQYRQTIVSLLDSSFLNKSKFTIDTNALARKFKADYPELDSATIIIPVTGHRLELVLKASTPVLDLKNSTGYYLLSDQGVVIKKFSTLKDMNSTKLVVLTDDSNSSVFLAKNFISGQTVSFIQKIIYQYSKKNMTITGMTLPVSPYELDVQSRGVSYIEKYNLLNDANYQIGTYFTTLQYIKTNNIPMPTQYVDLRVPGKAFFK